MLYRSVYHYAGQVQRGESRGFIAWLTDPNQRDLGIIKRHRKPPTADLARTDRA
jgi:hypothetical protein